MEQRTRQQKVLSYINQLVLYGYDQGIWHSLIIHTVLLTILALFSDSVSIHRPIAINISFSDTEKPLDISDVTISNDIFTEELKQAVDLVANQAEAINTVLEMSSPPLVSDIENPIQDQYQDIHTFTSNILASDLLIRTDDQHVSVGDVSANHSAIGNNADSVDITHIINSIAKGVEHNNQSASGDTGAGIEKRLSSYGAKTGDVQISLAWNTIDDIDLHVKFTPGNGLVDNIDWTNRIGQLSKGMLDIDMNANSAAISQTPVENIFWPPGSSPQGSFAVYVHFFRSWTGNTRVPVTVRIKNGIKVDTFQIIAHLYSNPQIVKQFTYHRDKKLKF